MHSQKVRDAFDTVAFDYDGLIPKLIPYYHEQHRLMLDLVDFEPSQSLKVLDLGSGTGVLSYLVLEAFPQATVVAFDLSEKMLEACQQNLDPYRERVTFQQGDFAHDALGSSYDLIISGLAIHHLVHDQKQRLFKRLYDALKPSGVFLDRDIVIGPTPRLTYQHEQLWRQYMQRHGENAEYWFNEYLEQDLPASVEDQLQWLKEAGFEDVGCHWRYLNFAIFGGVKPASTNEDGTLSQR